MTHCNVSNLLQTHTHLNNMSHITNINHTAGSAVTPGRTIRSQI